MKRCPRCGNVSHVLTGPEEVVVAALSRRKHANTLRLSRAMHENPKTGLRLLKQMQKDGIVIGKRAGIAGGGWEWVWSLPEGYEYQQALMLVVSEATRRVALLREQHLYMSARTLEEAIEKVTTPIQLPVRL